MVVLGMGSVQKGLAAARVACGGQARLSREVGKGLLGDSGQLGMDGSSSGACVSCCSSTACSTTEVPSHQRSSHHMGGSTCARHH